MAFEIVRITGQAGIQRAAHAVDDACLREQDIDKAEMPDIIGHLVGYTQTLT